MKSRVIHVMLGVFAVLVHGLAGCGGGGNSSTVSSTQTVASIALVGGNNQSATAGTELPEPLEALILDQAGLPIAGQVVNFKVVTGGGTVFAGAAASDADGCARERWTLGTQAGVQKIEVRAVDSTGAAVVYATFEAIAVAGAAQSVSIASGDSQSAQQLQPVPLPVKVVVKDAYGNPTPGISVAFAANNGGSALPESAVTDASGEAAATWTLGQAVGTQTLSALVVGLPPVSFSATVTPLPPGPATTIAKISGDSQIIGQHSVLSLQVAVTDVLGNPVPGKHVTFSAAPGSGYIRPETLSQYNYGMADWAEVITDSQGNATWSGYLHTAGLQKINASVTGIAAVTFSTSVTASDHPYDGWYDCVPSGLSFPQGESLPMSVSGGLLNFVNNPGWYWKRGTLNEVDGTLDAHLGGYSEDGANYVLLSGQLVIDSLQRATGAGTSTEYYGGMGTPSPNSPTGRVGTWSCSRR